MAREDGGPAYPTHPFGVVDRGELGAVEPQPGMSLRDWFAGQALAGFMANKHHRLDFAADSDAVFAYKIADAMLRARQAEGE